MYFGNGSSPASFRFHAPAQWSSTGERGRPAAFSASACAYSRVNAPPPHASGGRNGFAVGSPVHHAHQSKRFRFVFANAKTPRVRAATGSVTFVRLATGHFFRDPGPIRKGSVTPDEH